MTHAPKIWLEWGFSAENGRCWATSVLHSLPLNLASQSLDNYPEERFRFLDLPPELRNRVYEYYFDRTPPHIELHGSLIRAPRTGCAAIIHANKQVHTETLRLLYAWQRALLLFYLEAPSLIDQINISAIRGPDFMMMRQWPNFQRYTTRLTLKFSNDQIMHSSSLFLTDGIPASPSISRIGPALRRNSYRNLDALMEYITGFESLRQVHIFVAFNKNHYPRQRDWLRNCFGKIMRIWKLGPQICFEVTIRFSVNRRVSGGRIGSWRSRMGRRLWKQYLLDYDKHGDDNERASVGNSSL